MKRVLLISAAVAGLTIGLPVQAADVTRAMSEKHAEAYVEYRQSVFTLLKSNIAPLGGMAKGKIDYDAQVMETNAMRMEQLAAMLSDYLRVDTSDSGVESSAKASLWSNFDDVESKIADLKNAAANLQSVAKSGDESAYRDAIGKLGSTCKACHDDYKMD
ncbi:cytochrome c [Salinimonas sp. HHU 13199]|uniref:Cytochrome c n=1 Tax=Salinimonas profundi TaxID=2729140 RepID=A0ABR8LJ93_9ALTE|nr:cytochrome c [Salinimonas profundi]MBD3585011.1 cytochrome c [Salinimonas profundi]